MAIRQPIPMPGKPQVMPRPNPPTMPGGGVMPAPGRLQVMPRPNPPMPNTGGPMPRPTPFPLPDGVVRPPMPNTGPPLPGPDGVVRTPTGVMGGGMTPGAGGPKAQFGGISAAGTGGPMPPPGGNPMMMKKGGKVSSASKRADGIATKGKTRGRYL